MEEQLDRDPAPLIRRLTAEGAARAVIDLAAVRPVPAQLVHKVITLPSVADV